MEECKKLIHSGELQQDEKEEPLCFKWLRSSPGDGKTRAYFQCSSHQDCPVQVRAVLKGGSFWVEQNLASHSLLPCKKHRENSALSRQQESAVRTAIAQGVKPASILCHLTMEELQSAAEGPAEKRNAGGLEGVLTLPA